MTGMNWDASTVRGVASRVACLLLVIGSLTSVGCTHRKDGVVSIDAMKATPESGDRAHAELFVSNHYPSAKECAVCHPSHYEEWSASSHAYAQLSPIFNAMNGTLLQKTNGTLGDFCIRCHTPVGMALEEPLFVSNLERHPTSREGITCIVCHRVNQSFGKVSGRRSLVLGNVHEPVYGPTGGEEVRRVIADPDIEVATSPEQDGRKVHRDAERFFSLVQPSFCGTCHDVNLPNGLRLEEAFSEFKDSAAAKDGVTCQDCHMGTEPGIPSPRPVGPAARVAGVDTRERKLSNHSFVGPDYSVIHPGIFPHSVEAEEFATLEEWIQFDWQAGWGTAEFEERDEVFDMEFPRRWESASDRYDARDILDYQIERLEEVAEQRKALLKRGYLLGELEVEEASTRGLAVQDPRIQRHSRS